MQTMKQVQRESEEGAGCLSESTASEVSGGVYFFADIIQLKKGSFPKKRNENDHFRITMATCSVQIWASLHQAAK